MRLQRFKRDEVGDYEAMFIGTSGAGGQARNRNQAKSGRINRKRGLALKLYAHLKETEVRLV